MKYTDRFLKCLFTSVFPITCLLPISSVAAQTSPAEDTSTDLASLSIEELSKVTVTSVSKRPEPLSEAPAAVYVINQADINRSPATSLPELLYDVPNLQVQRINSTEYSISSRGFNGYDSSNKLLVQIDGRSIYTPLFSGVMWQLHSPLLEDIDRVEVISGPGGTLYGPNAVNGVINITTKDARDTIGGIARGTVSANEQTAALRYGVPLGSNGAIRAYVNAFWQGNEPAGPIQDINDAYNGIQAGFRSDIGSSAGNFTLQGDVFRNRSYRVSGDNDHGFNILGRYSSSLGPGELQIQSYYDYAGQHDDNIRDSVQTIDVSPEYSMTQGRHNLVLGIGLRTTKDSYVNDVDPFQLMPQSKRLWIMNAYAQDKYALTNRLSVTAGIKLERSTFSGVEILPNFRIAYQPNDSTLYWAAVSKAVRTPSRVDRELVWLPLLIASPDFQSEDLLSFEAGYRGQPTRNTSLSVSVFYNLYNNIRTTESPTGSFFPIQLGNSLNVNTYGIDAWATQQVLPWWRLRLGGTYLHKSKSFDPGHVDLANGEYAGDDPSYTIKFFSEMDLIHNIKFDLGLRSIDSLDRSGVDGFVEAEAHVAMPISKTVELFISGTNLLHKNHLEAADERAQLVERSVLLGSRIRF